MNLRVLLVGLIALSTIGFVVGTTIERNNEDSHDESAEVVSEGSGEAHSEAEEGGETSEESEEAHSEEAEPAGEAARDESEEEFKPFGIDIEAAPFVALAAIASLGLAVAAWVQPRWLALLAVIALAMLAFSVLDIREVFHQNDESETGLMLLAAVIALLHLAAAVVAGLMARESRSNGSGASIAG
jgi:hypothetical protein